MEVGNRRAWTRSNERLWIIWILVVAAGLAVFYPVIMRSLLNTTTTIAGTPSGSTSQSGASFVLSWTSCSPIGRTRVYIRLIADDTGAPIQNASVSGSPGITCDGVETTTAIIMQPPVNSSGIAVLSSTGSSWYEIRVRYLGQDHYFRVVMAQNQNTYVTMKLPSGSMTVAYR